jgi:hypothetical protein
MTSKRKPKPKLVFLDAHGFPNALLVLADIVAIGVLPQGEYRVTPAKPARWWRKAIPAQRRCTTPSRVNLLMKNGERLSYTFPRELTDKAAVDMAAYIGKQMLAAL